MLTERSELTVKAGTEEDFGTALKDQAVPLLESVDGVLSVRTGRGIENPSKFIMLVEWASMDAHAAYGQTPKSTELRGIMGPFVTGGAMEHFEIA